MLYTSLISSLLFSEFKKYIIKVCIYILYPLYYVPICNSVQHSIYYERNIENVPLW